MAPAGDRFDSDCVVGTQYESTQPHHAALRKRGFPGSVRIAPNWRRFVDAFCLCNVAIGLQGAFRGLCLCPGKLRFLTAKMALVENITAKTFKSTVRNHRFFPVWRPEHQPLRECQFTSQKMYFYLPCNDPDRFHIALKHCVRFRNDRGSVGLVAPHPEPQRVERRHNKERQDRCDQQLSSQIALKAGFAINSGRD
jgi:hypothetical protein